MTTARGAVLHTARRAPAGAPPWQHSYAIRLISTDVVALIWAVLGSTFILFRLSGAAVNFSIQQTHFAIPYLVIAALMIVMWLALLAVTGSRRYRILGTGTGEFKAVVRSAAMVFLVMVFVAYCLRTDLSRWYLLLATISGLSALLVSRWLWRTWLTVRRQFGAYSQRVLIVGSTATTAPLARDLLAQPSAGYWIVGACVSDVSSWDTLTGTPVPIVGRVDDVRDAVERSGADTVLIAEGHGLAPAEMRALSWSLEPGRQHLIMAPSLTDVAGPRIHTRPVAGFPLVHVEMPRYESVDRYAKRVFDIVGSLLLLLCLSPLLIPVAVTIATTSKGGILFSHERIGRQGQTFRMLKFRSMVPNADAMLQLLLQAQGSEDRPLFKIENDPRITPIGRFIRRYSIDEIPQLLNVLRGDMSLVGPRPQVAREVRLYDRAAARRLYVRPGMTGLWQVSGRSNLSWEESVRLDLYYVENWSFSADLGILWRTVRAVLASEGAV